LGTQGDMVGLIAIDFVLGLVPRGVVRVPAHDKNGSIFSLEGPTLLLRHAR